VIDHHEIIRVTRGQGGDCMVKMEFVECLKTTVIDSYSAGDAFTSSILVASML
jgi:sugar/nucleoside kinase (ribokinase family)